MTKSKIYLFEEGKTYLASDNSAWTFVKRNDRSVVWVNVDGKHTKGGKPSKGYISVAIIPASDGVQELVVLPKETKLALKGEEAVEAETQVAVEKPRAKSKKTENQEAVETDESAC